MQELTQEQKNNLKIICRYISEKLIHLGFILIAFYLIVGLNLNPNVDKSILEMVFTQDLNGLVDIFNNNNMSHRINGALKLTDVQSNEELFSSNFTTKCK